MQVSLLIKLKGQALLNKNNDLISQLPAIREALENGKKVEFETHGFSMIPLLHDGGDRVILQLNTKPLKINDVDVACGKWNWVKTPWPWEMEGC